MEDLPYMILQTPEQDLPTGAKEFALQLVLIDLCHRRERRRRSVHVVKLPENMVKKNDT